MANDKSRICPVCGAEFLPSQGYATTINADMTSRLVCSRKCHRTVFEQVQALHLEDPIHDKDNEGYHLPAYAARG